jgi:hypothetical protein
MTSKSFLIGPVMEGLRKDLKPWATPDDSFETLINAYQWRGRIVRRSGYTLLGRLANNTPVMGLRTQQNFISTEIDFNLQSLIAFDTTKTYKYDSGTESFIPLPIGPQGMDVTWSGTDYQFFYTINYAGAFWATNSKPGVHGFNITNAGTDAFTATNGLTGTAATVVVNAPGNTFVVGDFVYFLNLKGAAAANNLMYGIVIVAGTGFTIQSLDPNGTAFVNGQVTSGIALSTTNSIAGQDGIRYYGALNYTGGTSNGWANYNPPIDPNNCLAGCLLMFSYRGYLVFLGTWEGPDSSNLSYFGNRARWTQIGTPYYSLPVPTTPALQTYDPKTVRDDLFGRGGANDAPTAEMIVAAAFIRDILVVYFERSTWRLRFVNNSQNPFVWERINVELGSDCTFSSIPFDKGHMAIGNRGIVISDGNDTQRFDEKIPDDIFTIRQTNNGFDRVYGIRTFRTKLNYWTFPSASNPNGIYPDSTLVFNYDSKNWSFFDDCFTCFGYFYPSKVGKTWGDLDQLWPNYDNETAADGVSQQGFETVVAGNQQGFVFELEQSSCQNDPSLFVQSITLSDNTTEPNTLTTISSPNNNLPDGTWIKLTGVTGTTSSDGVSLNDRNFKISNPNQDANDFTINEFESIDAGTAIGGSFTYQTTFVPILSGSVQINVGSIEFLDSNLDGLLFGSDGTSTGVIDYDTGEITLFFVPALGISTEVYIRVVSFSSEQNIVPVQTITAYTGGGLITKISNVDIQTKYFNFFGIDEGIRLSKIDFYVDRTAHGQFTCNVFGDSSNSPVNAPLSDNPQSNIVVTSINPYQTSGGAEQTIYRLFADCIGQSLQFQLTLSDQQMAVSSVNDQDIEILAMIFSASSRGRLV